MGEANRRGTFGEDPRVPIQVPTIDQEAHNLIYGDREQTYGHPSKNLQLIADFWTSYIKGKEVLTCDDVCNMMILMKTARLKNMPEHRDSLVDTIGYTLLKERCREGLGRPQLAREKKIND